MATIKERKATERAEYIDSLRAMLDESPRDHRGRPSLIVSVESVSRSGMTRRMRVFYIDTARRLIEVTGTVARAIDWSRNDQGIKVDGCGMDMRFHLCDVIARTVGTGYNEEGNGIANGNDIYIRTL